MENNSRNLGDILAKNYFTIPNYQRAYAWDAEQLNIFMDDLKNYRSFSFQEKPYFLGTFLFSVDLRYHSFTNYFIVDGQQRLTTSILYVACLLRFLNKRSIETSKWKELFIGDRSCRRLKAIEPDNAFFDQYAL